MSRWVCLFALLGSAVSVGAADTNTWQPTGPFKVQPAIDRCVAVSAFKRGDQNLLVAFEGNPTTDDYAMYVYAPGSLGREPWVAGTYSLGSIKPETDWVVARPSNRAGVVVYEMKTTQSELTSAGVAPELKIREIPSPGWLAIAGLNAVIPLLESCSVDLLERWGYSKKFQDELAAFPEPKKVMASYASPFDYPVSALRARAQGDTYALIDVGLDGRSSKCRVIRSSGNQEIDKATCMIVTKRARYTPAVDRQGHQVIAPYYLTFRWEIPK